MSLDSLAPHEPAVGIEWPTLALIGVIYSAFAALMWWHDTLPLWMWLALAGWTAAWWGSTQHEMLHGHPTRSRLMNTALATPPFWLWLPFERYRATHLAHHQDQHLTDPLDDPETRYVTAEAWAQFGPIRRAIVHSQGTLLGRLTLGPPLAIALFWIDEARTIARGNIKLTKVWALHVLFVGLWLGWVIGVCGVPLWQYLLGVVYLGTSLTLIRSFCEHRAHETVSWRTAVVENSPLLGLLYLYNNLHVVHHRWPAVPWYRLPALYRRHRAAVLAHNGGLVYRGYGDIFRRYLLRRHDTPVHPLNRRQAGNG